MRTERMEVRLPFLLIWELWRCLHWKAGDRGYGVYICTCRIILDSNKDFFVDTSRWINEWIKHLFVLYIQILYMHMYTICPYIYVVHVNMSQIYDFMILRWKSYKVNPEELIEWYLPLWTCFLHGQENSAPFAHIMEVFNSTLPPQFAGPSVSGWKLAADVCAWLSGWHCRNYIGPNERAAKL